MAGHSKWANIKHRKAAQDAKRGKIFTKLIRELVVAARQGGGNPDDNPRLRAALDKALGANMTRDTAQRAIDRGAGNDDEGNMDEITYEGYFVMYESDGRLTLRAHDQPKSDKNYFRKSVTNAASIQKFHVDVLGNIYPAPPEQRRGLA